MSNLITKEFDVFAFRAIDEPELCQQYLAGHRKVLTDYGIENVTTNKQSWMFNPHIYCVVARDNTNGELVGGVRIQLADGNTPLPIEEAIGIMDNALYRLVEKHALNGGIGESCGLWTSKNVKGMGVPRYLMWGSVSSANQLNFATLIGICAGYTLKLFSEIGFVVDRSLGNNGEFHYPNEKYIAHVIGILNAITLETSNERDKHIMLSLRENLFKKHYDSNDKFNIKVNFNLLYKNITPLFYTSNNGKN